MHQDLQTVLRCHLAAFAALGGVPQEILYDRMKAAVTGGDDQGHIVYNRALVDRARHHDSIPDPVDRTGPRPRVKSSGRSATSARTSSSPAASAISTT
jgi:transposase